MKILQINNYHSLRGGSDRIYLETGARLKSAGHEVMWFAGAHAQNDAEPAAPVGFAPVADLTRPRPRELPRFLYNHSAARALEELIQTEGRPDVAHLHIYHGGLTTAILPVLRRHRIPVVQTAHEYKLACPVYSLERQGQICMDCITGTKLNVIRHRCKGGSALHSTALWAEAMVSRLGGDLRLVDRILCVSNRQRSLLAKAGVPQDKLALCHNFVDTESFRPVPSAEKQDYFLYFGRIETLKGVGEVVEAAKISALPVKIAGEGSWVPELTQAIVSLPHVSYLGRRDAEALRQLIAEARAVLVPSRWEEPFGLTVVEAMASATAVIGTSIGAIPELMRAGVDGLLVPPGDSAALARAMSLLTPERALRMGQAGRMRAEERFGPEAYIARLLNVYSDLSMLEPV